MGARSLHHRYAAGRSLSDPVWTSCLGREITSHRTSPVGHFSTGTHWMCVTHSAWVAGLFRPTCAEIARLTRSSKSNTTRSSPPAGDTRRVPRPAPSFESHDRALPNPVQKQIALTFEVKLHAEYYKDTDGPVQVLQIWRNADFKGVVVQRERRDRSSILLGSTICRLSVSRDRTSRRRKRRTIC